jgi:hypothetical protein
MAALKLGNITLPSDLLWSDEFDWTPIEQAKTYSLDGSLIIENQTRQAGRPITLTGEADQAWVTRSTVEALYALAQASTTRTLQLTDGRTFDVVFRHDQTAVEARPVGGLVGVDHYMITLRLMEV